MYNPFRKLFLSGGVAQFEKMYPVFKTVDGNVHTGHVSRWLKVSSINCSTGKFLMYDISSAGYVLDTDDIMYPLENVVSLEWKRKDFKDIVFPYYLSEYKFYYTDEELDIILKEVKDYCQKRRRRK